MRAARRPGRRAPAASGLRFTVVLEVLPNVGIEMRVRGLWKQLVRARPHDEKKNSGLASRQYPELPVGPAVI